jgi:hypothetical protein
LDSTTAGAMALAAMMAAAAPTAGTSSIEAP